MNDSFVKSITDLIQGIYDKVVASAGVLVGVSTTIAGIGCLVYIATIILPMIERGQRIEIYPLLKPIFVAFVITNFVTLTSAVSDISTKVGTAMSSLVSVGDANASFKTFKESVDKMLEAEKAGKHYVTIDYDVINDPNSSVYDGVAQDENGVPITVKKDKSGKVKTGKENIVVDSQTESSNTEWFEELLWTVIYGYIIPGLAWVAFFLGQLFYIFMYLSSKFYLAILTIVGPLSFALSQFKVLAGSASQWLARFISISLWPGLCGLIQGINHMLMNAIAQNLQPTFTGVIVSIVLLIFSATLYFHVPTIADFVIQSGGIGGSAGTAKKMGNTVMRKIRGK